MQKILPFLWLFGLQTALAQSFKVVGYLPHYRFSWLNDIEFERLTHVNIAFANPDAQGNLSVEGVNITPAVTKAHQKGCKVFISLAGGYLTPATEANWNNLALPANRPAFIQKIVQYVQSRHLDGVDVDLEWQYVQDWYSPFVLELKAALAPLNLPLTAALPGGYRYPQITPAALAAYDWVNMMVYDLTGPWDPSNPGQHSPYDWAEQCIQYWQNQGVDAQQLTLGVPFYGYDFGASPVESFTYRGIVNQDPTNAQLDQVGQKYWNGMPTIQAKTQLALDEVAGIMIWEVGQDAFGENAAYSLLRAIDAVVDVAVVGVSEASSTTLQVYPNPVRDRLSIRLPGEGTFRLLIHNMQGALVLEQSTAYEDPLEVRVADLPGGMYGISVYSGSRVMTGKFVKM
ncbi:MAG: T9SS type A sorting domain-containing protein [Saprospiraceae bacterium]|nr:T9SS type A sorting domain-containing protein [Saprospiraceae bacterium]